VATGVTVSTAPCNSIKHRTSQHRTSRNSHS